APDPILMNDKWSRPIAFKYGPDGSVYMIDWYDKQACHNPLTEIWDRSNGRIFKIGYKDAKPVQVDLAKLSDEELVKLQLHPNDWYVRHARRLLQERSAGKEVGPQLVEMLKNERETPKKLRALWALHCSGGLTKEVIEQQLKAEDEHLCAWAIQLATETLGPMNLTNPPAPHLAASHAPHVPVFAEMAKSDPSPVVRLYLASALQRMAPADRWTILDNLVAHSDDASDHNLPLMYWYAAEPAMAADMNRGVELAKKSKIPLLRELIARRLCAIAAADAKGDVANVNVEPLNALTKLLTETDDAAFQKDILAGMSDGLRGWPRLPTPENWSAVYDKLSASADDAVRNRAQELSVVFGEERALASLRNTVADDSANLGVRKNAIEALVGAGDQKVVPLLQQLIGDATLRGPALRGLAAFDAPNTPDLILAGYGTFDTTTKVDALNTLASRAPYAKILIDAVKSEKIAKTDITAATLRQLGAVDDKTVQAWLIDNFGKVKQTPKEKLDEIARWKERLARKTWADRADPSRGRTIYAKACMQCHTLFDTGGKVGPDLTGSNRADVTYALTNIIDPSAVIGKDYLVSIIKTKDKRVLSGIIKSDDGNVLTLQTEAELIALPRSQITFQKEQDISMMPDGLLAGLKNDEVRDLVAYLGASKQVPMLATTQSAPAFFNGKDLTGWSGDKAVWSVENGEIVGKSATGLAKNEFLVSDLAAGDFRLTLEVKLTPNAANSGIQFRSEVRDGEVTGYQADVGEGWWGKLYEEHGRALLWPPTPSPGTPGEGRGEGALSPEQHIKPGDWNTYEIVAVGDKVMTALNGKKCVDLDDPAGAKRGIFALQVHSGGPTEVRFRNLKLEIGPTAELVTDDRRHVP
ncbi:MAG: family 16 glycoside hydrolase, partial [Tepidisphaeraceae bacterium]